MLQPEILLENVSKVDKDTEIIRPEICNGLHKCKIYKPTQEEKLANVLANAGGKLLNKRKDHLKSAKSWRRLDIEKPKVKRTSHSEPLESIKETNDLDKSLNDEETQSISNSQNITIEIDDIKQDKKDDELDEFIDGIDSKP